MDKADLGSIVANVVKEAVRERGHVNILIASSAPDSRNEVPGGSLLCRIGSWPRSPTGPGVLAPPGDGAPRMAAVDAGNVCAPTPWADRWANDGGRGRGHRRWHAGGSPNPEPLVVVAMTLCQQSLPDVLCVVETRRSIPVTKERKDGRQSQE